VLAQEGAEAGEAVTFSVTFRLDPLFNGILASCYPARKSCRAVGRRSI
jgi:hypothetical protein